MDTRPLLLIQTGSPPEPIRAVTGDISHWFLAAIGQPPAAIEVLRVFEGEPLPEPGRHRAAIITGSWAMVTERLPWSEATAAWIRRAVAEQLPLLGVCYGHQLMAHALGGTVGYHPAGREMGRLEIERLPAGDADPWLAEGPPRFPAHLTHLQTVLQLPPGAQALARSAHDPHQIVRYGPAAVSVQFHPEITPDILAACIAMQAPALQAEGLDPSALLDGLGPTPAALALLHRFVGAQAGRGGPALSAAPPAPASAPATARC